MDGTATPQRQRYSQQLLAALNERRTAEGLTHTAFATQRLGLSQGFWSMLQSGHRSVARSNHLAVAAYRAYPELGSLIVMSLAEGAEERDT
jgi:hypothetical protein